MELVYLSNGQACYLKETIGNKFIVNKIFEYEDEENGLQEIEDGNDNVVDKIFHSKPIEKIASELKELQSKKQEYLNAISELESKKRTLKYEVEQITKTQISNSKFILNRTELLNAATLALFVKDRIMPITLNNKERSFRGLKLSLSIEISTGTERRWGYKLYDDYAGTSGDYLCEKYGILINPTEEEIDTTIRKRLLEFKFSDYCLKSVDDKYLTAELLSTKNAFIKNEKIKEKENLEKELLKITEKLSKL